MIKYVVIFSLMYSALNWLIFVWTGLKKPAPATVQKNLAKVELQGFDADKVISSAGDLAGAFKSAGPNAVAAAMSLVGLIVAAVAAGVDKI